MPTGSDDVRCSGRPEVVGSGSLATSVDKVPSGQRWIHEVKFDGYRVQVHLRDAVVKVFTRRGNDWTNRFRKIAADAWHINAGSAIIFAAIGQATAA
jgi:ATP-dependent DNA ligase